MEPLTLLFDGRGNGPAARNGLTPGSITTFERGDQPAVDHPQSIAHRVEETPIVRDHEDRGRAISKEILDGLARTDVQVVRRFVEEQHIRGRDAQQREFEAASLSTGQEAHFLERIVAAEQEPREVRACLAIRDAGHLKHGVQHGRSRDPGGPELREVAELDAVAEDDIPVQGREVARHRPKECRLAGTVRTHDPDPVPPLRRQEWRLRDPRHRSARCGRRQVADRQVRDPDHDFAGSSRTGAEQRGLRQLQPA